MRMPIPALLAALAFSGCCKSIAASPPGVDDLSSHAADGPRTLRQSVVFAAPVPAVWAAFTTTAAYTTWAVPVASIDFRLGE